MDFQNIVDSVGALGLNLYDFAIYTSEGVFAHRFRPGSNCNNSYSVAKAYVMTAVGMLWDEGKIQLTDPLRRYFSDDFPPDRDPGWMVATVEHAMTHRLGFDEDFLTIDVDDLNSYPTDDYLSIVLSHPLAYVPGMRRCYGDAAYYLLSRLVSKVTGKGVDSLLNERLFRPMGIREVAWSRCPKGYPIGATGLYISSVDMLKLGAMYLEGGVYDGRRYVSQEWVDRVIASEYEFYTMTPNGLIGKGGMYGQALMFSRENHFAVAWHGYVDGQGGEKLIDYLDHLKP